jgi:predicted CopG family antitoxin
MTITPILLNIRSTDFVKSQYDSINLTFNQNIQLTHEQFLQIKKKKTNSTAEIIIKYIGNKKSNTELVVTLSLSNSTSLLLHHQINPKLKSNYNQKKP